MTSVTEDESIQPIRTPRAWVERRLAEASPELSADALTTAEEDLANLSTADPIYLRNGIDISYFPDGLADIANKVGIGTTEVLGSVTGDLANGVCIQIRKGQRNGCLLGARWRMNVRPQLGKNSRRIVLVFASLQQQNIPTRQPSFRPQWVRFHPIWDEVTCDPEELDADYRGCLQSLREADDAARSLRQRLGVLRKKHEDALRQVRKELDRGTPDVAVRDRSLLHTVVRKQYSALRVMMDLLKLRSDCEQHSFQAVVSASDKAESQLGDGNGEDEAGPPNLQLQAEATVVKGSLEEGSLVEIREANQKHACRAKVLSCNFTGRSVLIEVDLSATDFNHGTEIQVDVISRFNWWAHQKAVQDLLNEQVQGYWPDLATLLCCPADLPSAPAPPIPSFFCDLNNGGPPLNARQRAAVAGALATPHAFCIQGPPGTGKTTVICELVQQLIARGERILLAAPTHVAVDEVLRRIGAREGVRALRLSWDDTRIADDVRKFAPSQIIEPFLERAQRHDSENSSRWQQEQARIQSAVELLKPLHACQSETRSAAQVRAEADHRTENAQSQWAADEPSLNELRRQLAKEIQAAETGIAELRQGLAEVKSTLAAKSQTAGVGTRVLGWFNRGELGRIGRQRDGIARQLQQLGGQLGPLRKNDTAAEERLTVLREEVSAATRASVEAAERLAKAMSAESEAKRTCSGHPALGDRGLEPESVASSLTEFTDRHSRLDAYGRLRSRFDEIVAEVTSDGENLDGLRRDLLAVTNLFCCTTTGIAGNQELRDVVVDTLIVDEASRVTDSEFLIGAVRAKRWILVGDEHQLPPYVEQSDEHFIHALSALDLAERRQVSLEAAVDELGNLWEEDEELHLFRRQNVAEVATTLLDAGLWASTYRQAFRDGIDYLGQEVENPTRELLRTMRDNLIRSLFERIVVSCPDSLKLRLVEQRRMVESIARIVSQPIYGGDYCTPPAEEMRQQGLVPLSTPTFPTPITFLDTSALGVKARDESIRNGFVNRTEAHWIIEACEVLNRELSESGSRILTVSILAFYKAQARLIRDKVLDRHGRSRFQRLRFSVIDAIDRIQGQESDIVFLSFCRTAGKTVSPRFGQWLQDLRRVNVACTRAHRALILVGQKELLGKLCSNDGAMQFYRHLNELFESHPDTMRVVRQFGGAKHGTLDE